MPATEGRTPAQTCPDCGAVASFVSPLGNPTVNYAEPSPTCGCHCHEVYRFIFKKRLPDGTYVEPAS